MTYMLEHKYCEKVFRFRHSRQIFVALKTSKHVINRWYFKKVYRVKFAYCVVVADAKDEKRKVPSRIVLP